MSQAQIAAIIAAIGLVSGVVGFCKPFVEALPFARPGSTLHDPTLRLLNVALNLAAVLAMAATFGVLSWQDWLSYLLLATGQAVGSHALFTVVSATTPEPTGLNEPKTGVVLPVEPSTAAPSADATPAAS